MLTKAGQKMTFTLYTYQSKKKSTFFTNHRLSLKQSKEQRWGNAAPCWHFIPQYIKISCPSVHEENTRMVLEKMFCDA